MTILVVGATGATGRLLVGQLLNRGHKVKAIVRSPEKLPGEIRHHEHLEIIRASILDIDEMTLKKYVSDCDAVASCLGHNLTFKGLFGNPKSLVTEAVMALCNAIIANGGNNSVKFVLMNTTANRNKNLIEPLSMGEKIFMVLLRLLLPPQRDNEKAADYLRTHFGSEHSTIEWTAVRPDGLIDEDKVSEYKVFPSPVRSPIFNAGKTSRINVGHFMAELISEKEIWDTWKGQMPVLYNSDFSE